MYYIIGLGNPGEKYRYTKHNVAWIILNELFPEEWTYHKYMNAETYDDGNAVYIKPHTFMNRSGEVVAFLKKENISLNNIVVIYDDLDLPFGKIRISYNRGTGGHKGIASIIEHLGTQECIRIRIGISKQHDDGSLTKPSVLGNFSPEELDYLTKTVVKQIYSIITTLDTEGREVAMNKYNSNEC